MTDTYETDRQKMLVKRNRYWASLRDMRSEFMGLDQGNFSHSDKQFYEWVKDKYGIEVLEEGGMIMGRYNIVDDSKYLVYWLKYGR